MNSKELTVSDCEILIDALSEKVVRYEHAVSRGEGGKEWVAKYKENAEVIINKLKSIMRVKVYLTKQTGTHWWLWADSSDHIDQEWQRGLSSLEKTKKWLIVKLNNPHIIFEVIGQRNLK
jgi:hypothetical protein